MSTPKYREFKFGVTRGEVTAGEGGVQYLRSVPLGSYAVRITDRFVAHAKANPTKSPLGDRLISQAG